jgi:hypothetical protein
MGEHNESIIESIGKELVELLPVLLIFPLWESRYCTGKSGSTP